MGFKDGTIALWSMTKNHQIFQFRQREDILQNIDYQPHKNLVLANYTDGSVELYSIKTGYNL